MQDPDHLTCVVSALFISRSVDTYGGNERGNFPRFLFDFGPLIVTSKSDTRILMSSFMLYTLILQATFAPVFR